MTPYNESRIIRIAQKCERELIQADFYARIAGQTSLSQYTNLRKMHENEAKCCAGAAFYIARHNPAA